MLKILIRSNIVLISLIIKQVFCADLNPSSIKQDIAKHNMPICLENAILLHIDSRLNISQKKKWFYSQESYFREAYYQFKYILGDDMCDKLTHITYVVLRPDAIVSHAFGRTVDSLVKLGFRPFYLIPFTFNKFTIREVWRYNLNRSPLERFKLIDLFLSATPSFLILLEDVRPKTEHTASSRLRSIKGSIIESKRNSQDLRTIIGAKDRLFSFIHTPDDESDIIREIGILFESTARNEIIQAIKNKSNLRLDIINTESQISNEYPKTSLDYKNSVTQLKLIVEKQPQSTEKNELLEICKKAANKEKIDWVKLLQLIEHIKINIPIWTKIIIAAYNAEDDVPGVHSIIFDGECYHDTLR